MKGFTKDYFELFLEARDSFIESDVKKELGSGFSNYRIIYDEISRLLNDPSGIGIDSIYTRKQLVIEERLNPELSESIREALTVFQAIREAVTDKVFDFSKRTPWVKAIHYSIFYYIHRKIPVDHVVPEEYNFIAESLFCLKKRGFKIESIDGRIESDDDELKRLFFAIDYRAKKLGKKGFIAFISAIEGHYSKTEERFFFYRRRSVMPTSQKPSAPYGYVFNLFVKNLNLSCKVKVKEQERLLDEIQYLSTHLATILDLDKMSPWSHINVDSENIIDRLVEWILYPEVYYIPQISPVHGKIMFPRIFELIDDNTEDGFSEIKKASRVMEKIEDSIRQKGAISGELVEEQIIRLCSDIDNFDGVMDIIKKISIGADEVNKGYVSPFDAEKSNVQDFPLIRTADGYVVSNIGTYNIAKYRALLRMSDKYNRKIDQRLGFALEEFIKERFDASNIRYHHSFKYAAPEYIREIIKTNRHQGECDFIIESSDYVYLIEVKKKGLTKESKSGSVLHFLLDTALSFFRSINQLTIAELILLNEGRIICLNSDKEVELGDRDVFKLVISLEDMASLQCDDVKNSILQGLYGKMISVSDESLGGLSDIINKNIYELSLLHDELMRKGDGYKHAPFHCLSYISTPQLLNILDDVYCNDDFSDNVLRSNSVVYSLMDWYASYKASKSSKFLKDNKRILRNTVLVR